MLLGGGYAIPIVIVSALNNIYIFISSYRHAESRTLNIKKKEIKKVK